MPCKETRPSDQRLKFIAEVLSGDAAMADLCRYLEFRGFRVARPFGNDRQEYPEV